MLSHVTDGLKESLRQHQQRAEALQLEFSALAGSENRQEADCVKASKPKRRILPGDPPSWLGACLVLRFCAFCLAMRRVLLNVTA